jgi:DNA-binding Xre family transcriptional regulator
MLETQVERVVLNTLAEKLRLCRLISCAFGDLFAIVFGEADPP